MVKLILAELKNHSPFTSFGAATGIVLMIFFSSISIPAKLSYSIFYTLHPLHVLLSAVVTTSMYKLHLNRASNLLTMITIGYAGSIGISTLSDSIIPYLGEVLLAMPNREAHIGFIEEWWLINPMALAGIIIAYYKPTTKFPHSAHVLVSTWASLFHIIMALGKTPDWISCVIIFFFLFISVWIPCCFSDIVFPLFFVQHK